MLYSNGWENSHSILQNSGIPVAIGILCKMPFNRKWKPVFFTEKLSSIDKKGKKTDNKIAFLHFRDWGIYKDL